MTIPIRVKLLTKTAKAPQQSNEGDLLDLFADGFCAENLKDTKIKEGGQDKLLTKYTKTGYNADEVVLFPTGRILVKTGISLELPKQYWVGGYDWFFEDEEEALLGKDILQNSLNSYAVADLRPRSGLALKHGITVLNAPATIDNSYRKEIGVILINHGHEPYTIRKGDKIAQMLIRPLYPNKMEIVENINDSERGAYGSSGK
jgi:dUTP pyrophosphatase